MRWSKLKQKIEKNFATSVQSRLAIHSTTYGDSTCGHAWLTMDGEVIANFCTRAHYSRFLYGDKSNDAGLSAEQVKRYENQPVDYGEISRQDVYEACWAYVHDLSFTDALNSGDPLLQSLAVLDRHLGKRRYAAIKTMALHPLALKLFELRVSIEKDA